MAHGIYLGMTAASARVQQLDQVADNLANAQTPGFKATRAAFESFLPKSGIRPGRDDYAATATVRAGVDMRPGMVQVTGRPLDVLPQDNLYLGVLMPDGDVGYTRDGHLSVSPDGLLMAAGQPVVDEAGSTLFVPAGAIPSVNSHGGVMLEGGRAELGRLGLFALDGGMDKVGPSTLMPAQDGAAVQKRGNVNSGQIELANYSVLDAAVQMVSTQRAFEHATQALEAYRALDQIATSKIGSAE